MEVRRRWKKTISFVTSLSFPWLVLRTAEGQTWHLQKFITSPGTLIDIDSPGS